MILIRPIMMILMVVMSVMTSYASLYSPDHYIRHFSMADGLNHLFVDDLLLDSNGFLWVASAGGGLSRYDAYDFIGFGLDFEFRKLSGNYIIKLTEDNHKRLWIAARDGLDIVDINAMCGAIPYDKTGKLSDLMKKRTFYVVADALGRIWINNIDGLACVTLDSSTGDVVDISTLEGVYHEPNLIVIKDVCNDGSPWILIRGQVYRLLLYEGHSIRLHHVSNSLIFDDKNLNATDFINKDSDIWIATNFGLIRYDKVNDRVRHYHYERDSDRSLSHDYVTSLAVTSEGRLLVGTSFGIDEFSSMTDDFERFGRHDGGLRFVNCLLSDGERIWVGTERSGLILFRPCSQGFRTIVHQADNGNSIAQSPVNAVYQDADGDWWIGTSEHGLQKTDSSFSYFEDYKSFNSVFNYPSVTSVCSDKRGIVWAGTWGHGVVCIDKHNGMIKKHLVTSAVHEQALKFITMLQYDHVNDIIWISTNQGLLVYDIQDDKVEEPFSGAFTTASWMLGGVIDNDSLLWLVGKYGLYKINLLRKNDTGGFYVRHFRNKLDIPGSDIQERLSSICLTSDGNLWIGSNGNGLYIRRPGVGDEDVFESVSPDSGLSGNSIVSIHEDARGRLWIVSTKGITCSDGKGSGVYYGKSDLIPASVFSENASFVGNNGNIVIGTSGGLLVVDPSVAGNKNVFANRVRITDILVDGIAVTVPVNEGEKVSLHESDKSIEINFSALDYDRMNTSGGRYFCRLKGFDESWDTLAPGRHHAKYTNLSPGNYEFNVIYSADGYFSDSTAMTSIPVNVTPYLYKRWWFILIIALLAIAAVVYVYKWRVDDLTRQKKILQNTVEERTQEIKAQKSELEERNRLLTEVNREVSEQKAELSDMIDKVRNLTSERINFFTSVTHEFRTPVTLIAGPIKKALKMTEDPEVIEQLGFAEQNSKYLLSLINQIMDFRKVESGNFKMSFVNTDFIRFIKEVVYSFSSASLELGIKLRLILHIPDTIFVFSEEGLRKVMVNLISNALRHTPGGGFVTIYCALLNGCLSGERKLYICVSDTGCGVAEEDIQHIFDRFYQGSEQPVNTLSGSTGSGIGLHICRSIIMACGGNIFVKNNHGKGCSFKIIIPIPDNEDRLNENQDLHDSMIMSDNDYDASDVSLKDLSRQIMTIMVVEDNLSMRKYIHSILGHKYAVVEASNGKEALEILANNQVDFIITDLMMPVMDGHELSRRLKTDITTSHIPVLVLTAKTSQETRIESYRTGVDEYLSKPFDEDLLLARIDNILENKSRYQRQFAKDMDVSSLNIEDTSLDKHFLDKMMEVVEKNYVNVDFEVADFAREMGLGRNVLNQKMLSLVGQTAWQFVKSYRLKVAYEKILGNQGVNVLTISEIAYDSGFSDPKYFSKSFSRQFGISPRGLMKREPKSNES